MVKIPVVEGNQWEHLSELLADWPHFYSTTQSGEDEHYGGEVIM